MCLAIFPFCQFWHFGEIMKEAGNRMNETKTKTARSCVMYTHDNQALGLVKIEINIVCGVLSSSVSDKV